MIKPVLKIFAIIIVFCWAKWFADNSIRFELYGISIGILITLLIELFDCLIKERKFLYLYWQCIRPWSNSDLRLSFSYLFKIEVNGRYLLVRSNRLKDTYQPVGGVYKYFNPEANNEFHKMGISSDNNIKNDDVSEFDLRLNIPKKSVKRFLTWFFKKENRESDPWREFYEELIRPGILPASKFSYIHSTLVGQDIQPIHFDLYFKIDTLKYADIYIPKFISADQIEEIRNLQSVSDNEDYIWATREEIMQQKSTSGYRIAEHTKKIFVNKLLHQ